MLPMLPMLPVLLPVLPMLPVLLHSALEQKIDPRFACRYTVFQGPGVCRRRRFMLNGVNADYALDWGERARNYFGGEGAVNMDSDEYLGGQISGVVTSMAQAGGGIKEAVSLPASHFFPSVFTNTAKFIKSGNFSLGAAWAKDAWTVGTGIWNSFWLTQKPTDLLQEQLGK